MEWNSETDRLNRLKTSINTSYTYFYTIYILLYSYLLYTLTYYILLLTYKLIYILIYSYYKLLLLSLLIPSLSFLLSSSPLQRPRAPHLRVAPQQNAKDVRRQQQNALQAAALKAMAQVGVAPPRVKHDFMHFL